jgi:N-acetylneuraminic acid mutarotase
MDFMRSTLHLAIGLMIGVVSSCSEPATNPSEVVTLDGPDLATASNTWVRRANLPNTERMGLTSAVITNAQGQSVLYVMGGASDHTEVRVQAYNTATNTWINRKSLPLDLSRTNGAGVIGGKIYVSGGQQSGDKRYSGALLMYDPDANTWTRKRNMPAATWDGITGVLNNQLYVLTCEGEADCSAFLRQSLYRYDPTTDVWTLLSVTPIALGRPMGGFIGGKLYATGGPNGALLAYDPTTNTWATKASLPGGQRRWLGAGVTLAAKLYVLGGFEGPSTGLGTPVRKTSVYDPATDTWTNQAPMPTDRVDFTASRVVVDGKARIEAVGGPRQGSNVQYTP